jgi:hypothetical protein
MIVAFAAAALLAACALRVWSRGRPAAAAALALTGLFALSLGNVARLFEPSAPQLADLAYVTVHTRPTDTVLGESPGPGVFRPHAWFYFFLTGPFASQRDYEALGADLESGRIRPRIVILDSPVPRHYFPPAVTEFVRRRYRLVQGHLFERSED